MSIHFINDILIVDDDTTLVAFIIEALQDEGYLCCAAYDGGSALFAIETARPALVLLDLHLPGLTGPDVVAHLHHQGLHNVPVILMTGDAFAAYQLPTRTFPEYLLKPFDLKHLLRRVAHYVHPEH